MEDFLSLFRGAGWGWCLWNLRGAYGPLDSDRTDVEYEEFEGHRLDRTMLELLLRY
jgi:endoglucanase